MFASGMRLLIEGYAGEAVSNQFLPQDEETNELVIFLPGMGYSCDMPLFYYTQNLIEFRGSDLLRVEYAYGGRPEFRALPFEEQIRWLVADSTAAFRVGLRQREYRRVVLVGKSLGTLAIGQLIGHEPHLDVEMRVVWLTPLLGNAELLRQMGEFRGKSLVVIGTADPVYDAEVLSALDASAEMTLCSIDRAEHGIDIEGDVSGSIGAVGQAMRAVKRFLREPE